ncbi:hypothetical protein CEXT_3131 [Caerostris extrusa]|uniref:Uncharacterized protein n=1 Tax=Caerostris extrusa TaxID=172846 RepID=A0AAV4WHP9_CAEEX|nr:hypothetical protein CEXT_3131 [Caerostris extrusa]
MENNLEYLNHLTNEVVTGRVIGNKLKILPPSAEAHRATRHEISDERKLKSHTYLLSQEKQLKVIIPIFSPLKVFPQRTLCASSAAPYKAKDCPKPSEAPPCCALCKGNHTSNFSGCPQNPANFVPAPPPKTNYWKKERN